MHRREFFAGLIAAPSLLLPKRTFFLPPKGGWPLHGLNYDEFSADFDWVIRRDSDGMTFAAYLENLARECARSQT